jgi:hypothetical protein
VEVVETTEYDDVSIPFLFSLGAAGSTTPVMHQDMIEMTCDTYELAWKCDFTYGRSGEGHAR